MAGLFSLGFILLIDPIFVKKFYNINQIAYLKCTHAYIVRTKNNDSERTVHLIMQPACGAVVACVNIDKFKAESINLADEDGWRAA